MVAWLENGQGYFTFEDFKEVQGFDSLTESQKAVLVSTYTKHMKGFGTDSRRMYAISNIKRVHGLSEKVVKIEFFNMDWWHYNSAGEWY